MSRCRPRGVVRDRDAEGGRRKVLCGGWAQRGSQRPGLFLASSWPLTSTCLRALVLYQRGEVRPTRLTGVLFGEPVPVDTLSKPKPQVKEGTYPNYVVWEVCEWHKILTTIPIA